MPQDNWTAVITALSNNIQSSKNNFNFFIVWSYSTAALLLEVQQKPLFSLNKEKYTNILQQSYRDLYVSENVL